MWVAAARVPCLCVLPSQARLQGSELAVEQSEFKPVFIWDVITHHSLIYNADPKQCILKCKIFLWQHLSPVQMVKKRKAKLTKESVETDKLCLITD